MGKLGKIGGGWKNPDSAKYRGAAAGPPAGRWEAAKKPGNWGGKGKLGWLGRLGKTGGGWAGPDSAKYRRSAAGPLGSR